MKKKLKKYLKFGSLLFGILFVIVACQEETIDNFNETSHEKRLKRISLNKLNLKIGYIKNYSLLSSLFDVNKKISMKSQQKLNSFDEPWIITDEIVMIEKGNITFYTFKIGTNSTENEFYNLIVAIDNIGEIRTMRILEYTPSNIWLEDTSKPFNGEVKIQENDIFSVNDINNVLSAKAGSNQCVSGVTGEWECNFGNNHPPGGGISCTSWEYIITVHWGPCPEIIDAGDSSTGGGFPVDGGDTGGGGTTDSGSDNTNDDGNPPDDNENCILDADGNCLVDETTPMPPRELIEDDCDTSKEDLKKIFPNMPDNDAELLASIINDKGADMGLDTKEELWHFLAQTGHETGGFTTLQVSENLNYSNQNLLDVWPRRFSQTDTTKLDPDDYKFDAEKLANYVYCCRMGNGNEASEDGWKYRGRGIKQLTGKTNYTDFKTWYNNNYNPDKDFETNPDLISTNDTLAILSGLWFYKARVLDKITIDSITTVEKVTKKINGGTVGLPQRKERFKKAKDSITCQ